MTWRVAALVFTVLVGCHPAPVVSVSVPPGALGLRAAPRPLSFPPYDPAILAEVRFRSIDEIMRSDQRDYEEVIRTTPAERIQLAMVEQTAEFRERLLWHVEYHRCLGQGWAYCGSPVDTEAIRAWREGETLAILGEARRDALSSAIMREFHERMRPVRPLHAVAPERDRRCIKTQVMSRPSRARWTQWIP